MIFGVGTDVLEVARIEAMLAQHPTRLLERIFGAQEREEFSRRRAADAQRALRYLATRFAAKEAFAKAWGTGLRAPLTWQSVQCLNDESGRPELHFSPTFFPIFAEKKLRAHVSLSDERTHVVAFVVLEQQS